MQQSLNEQSARALLISAQQRGEKLGGAQAFAMRPASFIAVLKAEPGLIRWEKLAGAIEYTPMFSVRGVDWRIVITDAAGNAEGFRAKVVGPSGAYLSDRITERPLDRRTAVALAADDLASAGIQANR